MMNCWHCGPNVHLIWGGDPYLDGEDFPIASQEYGMVTNLTCPKCESFVEVYLPRYHLKKKRTYRYCSMFYEDDPVCDI